MCDPATITATVAVVSTVYSMQSQQAAAEYETGVSNYKSRVAENDAQRVRSKGVEEENIQRQQTAQLISKQRAQLGAAGVELGTGSALQLQEDVATLGEVDALRIRSNFEEKAQALETQAELLKREAPEGPLDKFKSYLGAGLPFSAGLTPSPFGTMLSDKWYTPDSAAIQQTG